MPADIHMYYVMPKWNNAKKYDKMKREKNYYKCPKVKPNASRKTKF